jgi:hypothetical protein
MSSADYNPFLKRNEPAAPALPPEPTKNPIPPPVDWHRLHAEVDATIRDPQLTDDFDDEHSPADYDSSSALPFQYELDSNDRFTKWFWSFASAAFITTILIAVIIRFLIAPVLVLALQLNFGVSLLIAAAIGAVYGLIHATWRTRKLCTAIRVDEKALILSYGSRHETIDPRSVDALMTLSGIDLNGEGKGFSDLRSIVLLSGVKVQKIGFEPISNARIFAALREACLHAWSIPSEGSLLPPAEIAEHHADRAGIDSLRRLRKYYGKYVMQLTFSAVSLIVLLVGGGALIIASIGLRNIRAGSVKFLIFSGGMIVAALSSLRRLPREFGILRKIKETEKSLAVALGIDFAR